MNSQTNGNDQSPSAERAPYEPPQVKSGPIFERTVLGSECDPTFFSCKASPNTCPK